MKNMITTQDNYVAEIGWFLALKLVPQSCQFYAIFEKRVKSSRCRLFLDLTVKVIRPKKNKL